MRFKYALIILISTLCIFGIASCGGSDKQQAASSSQDSSMASSLSEVSVPDVVGKSGSSAKDELEKAGLEADFTSFNGKTVINTSNWTVVSQEPAAGEVVKGGSIVTLLVTKNSEEKESKEEDSKVSDTNQQTEEKQDDGVTLAQKNALAKAKDYLAFTAFSYSGLIGQLEFEGFTTEEATYGADNCGADWNEQAAKKAQEYLDFTAFSHSGLVDQLVYEGFTYEEAEYGVSAVGL